MNCGGGPKDLVWQSFFKVDQGEKTNNSKFKGCGNVQANILLVHSKLRNQLRNRSGVEKAAKLGFCFHSLRGPMEIPDY